MWRFKEKSILTWPQFYYERKQTQPPRPTFNFKGEKKNRKAVKETAVDNKNLPIL